VQLPASINFLPIHTWHLCFDIVPIYLDIFYLCIKLCAHSYLWIYRWFLCLTAGNDNILSGLTSLQRPSIYRILHLHTGSTLTPAQRRQLEMFLSYSLTLIILFSLPQCNCCYLWLWRRNCCWFYYIFLEFFETIIFFSIIHVGTILELFL